MSNEEQDEYLPPKNYSDGHPVARSKKDITQVPFKPEGKTIGGLLASGTLSMEVAKGKSHDPLGRALRIVDERISVRPQLQAQRSDMVKRLVKGIRTGDTVRRTDKEGKYTVVQASVDTSDSGVPRHRVISHKSGKKYLIAESMLVKNK